MYVYSNASHSPRKNPCFYAWGWPKSNISIARLNNSRSLNIHGTETFDEVASLPQLSYFSATEQLGNANTTGDMSLSMMGKLTPASNLHKCPILALATTMITTRLIGHRDEFSLGYQACTIAFLRSASQGVGLSRWKWTTNAAMKSLLDNLWVASQTEILYGDDENWIPVRRRWGR